MRIISKQKKSYEKWQKIFDEWSKKMDKIYGKNSEHRNNGEYWSKGDPGHWMDPFNEKLFHLWCDYDGGVPMNYQNELKKINLLESVIKETEHTKKESRWTESALLPKLIIVAKNLKNFPRLRFRFAKALYILFKNLYNNPQAKELRDFIVKFTKPGLTTEQTKVEIKSKLSDFNPQVFKEKLVNFGNNLEKNDEARKQFSKLLYNLFIKNTNDPTQSVAGFRTILLKSFQPIKQESFNEFKTRKLIREQVEAFTQFSIPELYNKFSGRSLSLLLKNKDLRKQFTIIMANLFKKYPNDPLIQSLKLFIKADKFKRED